LNSLFILLKFFCTGWVQLR